MTDTSTSAPPTMLTREQIIEWQIEHLNAVCSVEDVEMVDSHLTALDRIEAQETEIGRLRGALVGLVQAFYTASERISAVELLAALAAVADTQEEAGDA